MDPRQKRGSTAEGLTSKIQKYPVVRERESEHLLFLTLPWRNEDTISREKKSIMMKKGKWRGRLCRVKRKGKRCTEYLGKT